MSDSIETNEAMARPWKKPQLGEGTESAMRLLCTMAAPETPDRWVPCVDLLGAAKLVDAADRDAKDLEDYIDRMEPALLALRAAIGRCTWSTS